MFELPDKYDVGVIIGRFQVPELHHGHYQLIDHVASRHDKVIIVLGVSRVPGTRNNPLDYQARLQMLRESYSEAIIGRINDMPSDEAWSRELDKVVGQLLTPSQSAVLYGSRDSFIDHYRGSRPTAELVPHHRVTGSEIRARVAGGSTAPTRDFRRGAVWGAYNRFPTCFPTVDVAVLRDDRLLLARKPNEKLWRFIGGFADPGSASWETNARREVHEEANIEITDPVYLGSFPVEDWRYRNEVDSVMTSFFVADYQSGHAEARDDIEDVMWFRLDTVNEKTLVPCHRELFACLVDHLKRRET